MPLSILAQTPGHPPRAEGTALLPAKIRRPDGRGTLAAGKRQFGAALIVTPCCRPALGNNGRGRGGQNGDRKQP